MKVSDDHLPNLQIHHLYFLLVIILEYLTLLRALLAPLHILVSALQRLGLKEITPESHLSLLTLLETDQVP